MASGATETRANVAGEYGGLGTFIDGHTWVDSPDKVFKAYPLMADTTMYQVPSHMPTPPCALKGCSTQLDDERVPPLCSTSDALRTALKMLR